ncbi:tetratricopeptide repeat protein [Mucilaginibacter sp. AW1-7]|uniref:tetratricopeptide repeat protein n=1 Tax=Mucilaginibacter sp. AW1-7 TaxID=3349874 RepID=UPI003F7369A4
MISSSTSSLIPPVLTKVQELPFEKISWENFELLCRYLIKEDGNVISARSYGMQGEAQYGVDLYAVKSNGNYSVFQCKNVKRFGAKKIEAAVNEFISGDWGTPVQEFVLCTRQNLRNIAQSNEIIKQGQFLKSKDVDLIVWDAHELNVKLKKFPAIVGSFFGDGWITVFCDSIYHTKAASSKPDNLEIITGDYFSKEIIENKTARLKYEANYYTRFNNNFNHIKRVIANDLYVKPNNSFRFNFQRQNLSKEYSIDALLSLDVFGPAMLMKINSSGGVGKSSLLWHLIRETFELNPVYYLKNADPAALDYIFSQDEITNKPIILYLDDALKNEEQANLLGLADKISSYSIKTPIILVCAERSFRYFRYSDKRKFEDHFDDVIEMIYSNSEIRDEVFDKVMGIVFQSKHLKSSLKKVCLAKFNEFEFESLIDSLYNLLNYLDKNATVSYDFEWIDWQNACIELYQPFKELYGLVAFFYQYGVEVPINYVQEYLGFETTPNFLIIQLIGSFDVDKSPIVVNYEKGTLRLKHEKIGEWFFKITDIENQLEKHIFKRFSESIQTPSSGYLYRNLFRKNPDFETTSFYRSFSNEQKLGIVENYLAVTKLDLFTEAEAKMLMEKHFLLLNLGKRDEAILALREILVGNKNNTYALTRLSSCIRGRSLKEAEQSLLKVLKISPNNEKALLYLFGIYHDGKLSKKLADFQTQIADLAESNSFFAFSILEFIKQSFSDIQPITRVFIKEMQRSNIGLRLKTIDVLTLKKYYSEAFDLLCELKWTTYNDVHKNKTARSAINLFEMSSEPDEALLEFAQTIISSIPGHEDNFFHNIILGRVFSSRKNNWGEALHYFLKGYNIDSSHIFVFRKICECYMSLINNASVLSVRLTYLSDAILFAEIEKDNFKDDGHITAVANLYYLFVLIKQIEIYLYELRTINPVDINIVQNAILTAETMLTEMIAGSNQEIKIIRDNDNLHKKYKDHLFIFTKASSLLSRLYDLVGNHDSLDYKKILKNKHNYELQAHAALKAALNINPTDPGLIFDFVRSSFKINDSSISNKLNELSYRNFEIVDKVRLARYLFDHNHEKDLNIVFQKWHFITSSDVQLKKELAKIYIDTKRWSYAVNILSELYPDDKLVWDLFMKLMNRMPKTVDYQLNIDKLNLLDLYFRRLPKHRKFIRLNICSTLYVCGEIRESKRIYNGRGVQKTGIDYNEFTQPFSSDLLHNLYKRVLTVSKNNPLPGISLIFDSLFELNFDFNSITMRTTSPVLQMVNKIVRSCLNKLFNQLLSVKSSTGDILYFFIICHEKYSTSLISKAIIKRLIDHGYKEQTQYVTYQHLLKEMYPVVSHFEHAHAESLEMQLIIARYYLYAHNYFKANEKFQAVRQTKNCPNKQMGLCYIGFADIVSHKLEAAGLNSYGGDIATIVTKINNAQKNILQAKELYPEFLFYEQKLAYLESFKTQFNLS